MQKKQVFNLEDSNVAALGSDLDKKCRLAAAQHERAWDGVGKAVGLNIWRIEKFHVVPSKTPAGTFYSDDSYIVLVTKKDKANPEKLRHDIHFWLGATTSQDEAGTAAYKTVELDDLLGGEPVQHREVMGYESEQFVNLFPSGVRTLEGGIESGFNRVKPEAYAPRLLQIKGRKIPRVTQVPHETSSFNCGDVFILDLGLKILQWNGKGASPKEKNRASQLARAIDDERGGKPVVSVFTQGDKDEGAFWKEFGKEPEGGAITKPEDDEKGVEGLAGDKKLFRYSDAGGLQPCGSNKKQELDSNDVFIFDVGNEVYVWVGKGASKEEKSHALNRATAYLKEAGRPAWLPIKRVLEGAENEVFEASFE